jgi:gamma-glutamylcyclotransferase (GGCT)/AIG2-like uncharacterized protein YtfP
MLKPRDAIKESDLVLVYGTLKKGEELHSVLNAAEFVGEGVTLQPFKLYHYSLGYPFAIPSEKGYPLKGEVYRIDASILSALDYVEGYPHYYRRNLFKVKLDSGKYVVAWIYYVKSLPYTGTHKVVEIKPVNGVLEWSGKNVYQFSGNPLDKS